MTSNVFMRACSCFVYDFIGSFIRSLRRLGRTSDARGSSGAVPTDNVPRRARYPHLLGDILGAVALAVLLIVSLYLPEVLEW